MTEELCYRIIHKQSDSIHVFENAEAYCQGIKSQAIREHNKNADEMYALCMQSKGYTQSN